MLSRFDPTPCRRRTAPIPGRPCDSHACTSVPDALANTTVLAPSCAGGGATCLSDGLASIHPETANAVAISAEWIIRRDDEGWGDRDFTSGLDRVSSRTNSQDMRHVQAKDSPRLSMALVTA